MITKNWIIRPALGVLAMMVISGDLNTFEWVGILLACVALLFLDGFFHKVHDSYKYACKEYDRSKITPPNKR